MLLIGGGSKVWCNTFVGLCIATALAIVFRQKYPKWWFNFWVELLRFGYRIGAYILLLTDQYPSLDEEQSVHIHIDYPQSLNRWAPLYKWILSIPHYICVAVLISISLILTIYAWFHIMVTGRYPRSVFDFVVGTMRWGLRVRAYAFVLTTDQYPPFSMQ